uniref:Uncharacterized protein n=1 Tax=Heterorhabditis bacteriophora TaxID=37862 RepID=A0A1I7WMC7_HETBA
MDEISQRTVVQRKFTNPFFGVDVAPIYSKTFQMLNMISMGIRRNGAQRDGGPFLNDGFFLAIVRSSVISKAYPYNCDQYIAIRNQLLLHQEASKRIVSYSLEAIAKIFCQLSLTMMNKENQEKSITQSTHIASYPDNSIQQPFQTNASMQN